MHGKIWKLEHFQLRFQYTVVSEFYQRPVTSALISEIVIETVLIWCTVIIRTNFILAIPRTWVAEIFSTEQAHFKSKNLFQFSNIVSPECFKFLYEQYFFIIIILMLESSPRLNFYCIVWKLLIPKN